MAILTIDDATRKLVDQTIQLSKHLAGLPLSGCRIDYDQEADVLYISLRYPQKATDNLMLDDMGTLLSYREEELVGITILDASSR